MYYRNSQDNQTTVIDGSYLVAEGFLGFSSSILRMIASHAVQACREDLKFRYIIILIFPFAVGAISVPIIGVVAFSTISCHFKV